MPKNGPIIIVEDETEDQELLKDVFEELKIPNAVRFFDTAASALEYLVSSLEKPFLILSDIYLPKMSGLDFLKRIHEDLQLRKKCVPFIFFTTGSNSSMIEQAYLMNAQGFFVKPITSEQLQQSLNAIVDYWKFARLP